MTVATVLAEVARHLQQDPDALRIKKMLLLASRNAMESDPRTLASIDMGILLQEVYATYPTLSQLKQRLAGIVQQVSKKAEYGALARRILDTMASLYQKSAPFAPPRPAPPSPDEVKAAMAAQSVATPQPWAEVQLTDYDPFSLRRDVMEQINPLRAKLLLFSALHHQLTFDDAAMSVLRQHSLDGLLYEALTTCSNPEMLEAKLLQAEEALGFARSNARTALPLLQVLKPLYVYAPPPAPEPQEIAAYPDAGYSDAYSDPYQPDPYQNAYQDSADPHQDYGSADDSSYETPYPEDYSQPIYPQQPSYPQQDPGDYGAWGSESDWHQEPSYSSDYSFGNEPSEAVLSFATEAFDSAGIPAPGMLAQSVAAPRVMDPQPDITILGPGLRQQIDFNAAQLMATIENVLSELGNELDEALHEQEPAAYMDLKHRLLRAFVRDIEGTSEDFLKMLNRLQESERRVLHPEMPADMIPRLAPDLHPDSHQVEEILGIHYLAQSNQALKQQLEGAIQSALGTIKRSIENKLSEFGNELDETLQVMSAAQGFQSKYKALRSLVQEMEAISAKFANLLDRMEAAERKLFGL